MSDPAAPIETGNIGTPGVAKELEISGMYAYVADGYAGFSVVELYTER